MTFHRTRCAHCRAKFVPERIGQIVHAECAAAHVIAKREKAEREEAKRARMAARLDRAETRRKKETFKRLPELIAEAQVAFNAFIRERDREKGCFVCERPFLAGVPGRVQHAGHVRSRGAAGHLRFNEDNCHGECEGCNGPRGAKPHQIEAGAIRRIGQERFDVLKTDNKPHKWQHDEVRGIRDHYKVRLKELKGRA